MWMTWLIAKRVFKFIWRDKRLLILMLLVPIVLALVIGYGFSGEIKHIPVVIVDLDDPSAVPFSYSDRLIDYLDKETDLVDVTRLLQPKESDWTQSKTAVLEGTYNGAIFFPKNFTDTLAARFLNHSAVETSIDVFLDNSNPQIGSSILKSISEAFQQQFGEAMGLSISTEFAYGENLTQLQYMAPSILPFAIFFMSLILSIISIIGERKTGTLDLLLLSPYRKIHILLGYLLSLSIISLLQSTILLLFTIFAFNVPIIGGVGAYFAVYIMLLLTSWCGMGLGFLLSTIATTELQAIQFLPMVSFIILLFSGILIPIESLPAVVRPISYLIPVTYSVKYLHIVMIEGTGFLWHWYIAPVIGFVVLVLFFANMTLRER
ncbi:MAG: ABC transporter permease [Candidatus Heimdallarchaeota archaeon]|nr:ABC transporter permease [Candidatus Heimdallarchaeota archaeon]